MALVGRVRPVHPMLKIQRDCPAAIMPTFGTPGAAGRDLYSVETIRIERGGRALVSTGLRMAIPPGMYGRVAPRSGLAVRDGIHVGAGVIDADYRGVVKVLLFNFGEDVFKVNQGDRIAQLILEWCDKLNIEEVTDLDADTTARGTGGFGSTGK